MAIDLKTLKRETTRLWQAEKIPDSLNWLERLTPLHYRLCVAELHAAVGAAHLSGDWSHVGELVEDWQATADLDADPELRAYLQSPDAAKDFHRFESGEALAK